MVSPPYSFNFLLCAVGPLPRNAASIACFCDSKNTTLSGVLFPNHLCYISDDQEYIGGISMVERAIELAKEDLLNEYGINVYEDKKAHTDSVVPETEYEYITLFDIVTPLMLSKANYLSRTISDLVSARITNNS